MKHDSNRILWFKNQQLASFLQLQLQALFFRPGKSPEIEHVLNAVWNVVSICHGSFSKNITNLSIATTYVFQNES